LEIKPIKPYLLGEIYSIHPSHTGSVYLFLKNPENRKNGIMTIGTIAETDFASNTTLPMNSPKDEPLKPIRK